MPSTYPWPEPPEHEKLIVRLSPGDKDDSSPSNVAVVEWSGERFTGIRPADEAERRRVSSDPMVFASPGLFDVQINGYWGRGFKDVDLGPESIRDLCWSIALSGSTQFLPTITTDAPETMQGAMANVAEACHAYPDVAAMVAGIHQEGPRLRIADPVHAEGPGGNWTAVNDQPPLIDVPFSQGFDSGEAEPQGHLTLRRQDRVGDRAEPGQQQTKDQARSHQIEFSLHHFLQS